MLKKGKPTDAAARAHFAALFASGVVVVVVAQVGDIFDTAAFEVGGAINNQRFGVFAPRLRDAREPGLCKKSSAFFALDLRQHCYQ